MDREQAIKLLIRVIKGARHANYNHTVDLAKLYRTLITGDGMDEMLKKFVRRETDEEFEQRVNLTEHIITSVCSNLMDVAYKVPRSSSKSRILKYKDNNEKNLSEIEAILGRFWGDKSLDDYMDTRFIELQHTDPNTFIVTEFKNFNADIERASPYPFEVNSANALDYLYDNNILQYLVCSTSIKYQTKELNNNEYAKKGLRYTIYLPNVAILFEQRDENLFPLVNTKMEDVIQEYYNRKFMFTKGALYEIIEPLPHGEPVVPAIRVGYYRDLFTDGQTFISPFSPAIPFMKKSIKANSEMDLTAALVAFPQKIQYMQPCDEPGCLNGTLADGKACPVCKGTGVKGISTSVQDAVIAPMPQSKEDFIPLDSLIKYVSPDVSILQWQEQYIDKLTTKCKSAIFNSDIFDKQQVAETATGKNIDLQNVYDVLYPMSVQFSITWEFLVARVAGITDLYKNLIWSLSFGRDFKMKSKDDYIIERKIAKDAGVSSIVLRELDNEIMRLTYVDNRDEYKRYIIQQSFNPFSGKTPAEITVMMTQNFVPKRSKILYQNIEMIFDDVVFDNPKFYDLKRSEQKKIIEEAVSKLEEEIEKETPEPSFNDWRS